MTETKTSAGGIILGWWRAQLYPRQETGATRALRARLRRADHVLDILAQPQVIALHQALGRHSPPDPLVLAYLAQLLALVQAHQPQRMAQLLGQGASPPLSNLRFQRLIRASDGDTADPAALAMALRRALPLIGRSCNVAMLGEDFLRWNEPTRIRWCFDYFGKTPPQADETAAADPDMEETV